MSEETLTALWKKFASLRPTRTQLTYLFDQIKHIGGQAAHAWLLEIAKRLLKARPTSEDLCKIIVFTPELMDIAINKITKLGADSLAINTLQQHAPHLKELIAKLKAKNDKREELLKAMLAKLHI